MLEFVVILATVLAGFGRMNAALVAASAAALMLSSYFRHRRIYSEADRAGLGVVARHVVWRSSWHALVASGMAFGGGIALRMMAGY